MSLEVWNSLSDERRSGLVLIETELEQDAIESGVLRYYRENAGLPPEARSPERRLISVCLPKLAEAIDERQKEIPRATYLSAHPPALLFCSIDPERLAFITLTSIFTAIAGIRPKTKGNGFPSRAAEITIQNLATRIVSRVGYELCVDRIKEKNGTTYRRQLLHRKKLTPAIIERITKKANIETSDLKHQEMVWIGVQLIALAITSTGILSKAVVGNGRQRKTVIRMSDEVIDVLNKQHERCEYLSPVRGPMVCPPIPWTDSKTPGGYRILDSSVKQLLFKFASANDTPPVTPPVVDALNILQDVEWRVNPHVLAAASQLWRAGGGVAGLPHRHGQEVPARPEGAYDSPALLEWRAKAADIHGKNACSASDRAAAMFKLNAASQMSAYDSIWFPHFPCFRGRMYPSPIHLSPQGDDLCRGLLEFATPCEPTKEAIDQVKIQLSAAFGFDKKPYDQRVNFGSEVMGKIGKTFDPFEQRIWMDAEEPFTALSCIMALIGAANGEGIRVPCARDGTCNGLQHLAALGRDEVGARAVNLIDSDEPNSVYLIIATRVNELIEEDCKVTSYASNDEMPPCWAWRGNVTKDTVKRSIMTTPYGVTKIGMRSQFISDGHTDDLEGRPYQLAAYMEGLVVRAMGDIVESARSIMQYLQTVAALVNETGKPLAWTAPTGFRVVQRYAEKKAKWINTALGRMRLRVDDTKRIVKRAQVRGVAPNYIHSLDASHMAFTAIACRSLGIPFYATHDSFKTSADKVRVLERTLREEFVKLHSTDLLATFVEQVEEEFGIQCPAMPSKGTLDIKEVLQAKFFFL